MCTERNCRGSLLKLLGLAAALELAIVVSPPASAQFVCTTNGDSQTCTNSGAAGNQTTVTNAGGDATTINSGAALNLSSVTNAGGNATTINSGAALGLSSVTNAGGNATTTNSGAASSINTQTFGGAGNATSTNSGGIGGSINTQTFGGGNATTTNSGGVGGSINTQTFAGGNATSTISGGVSGSINTQAFGAGSNATTTISGNVGGSVNTQAFAGGNAVTINSGTINGGLNTQTFGGGNAALILLAGSRIIGSINLTGTSVTVNFLSGNHNLTFNTLAGASVIGSIPFAVLGNRAAAVDPTPFAMTDRLLMDFSRTVSSSIPTIEGRPAIATGPMAFADGDDSANKRIADVFANNPGMSDYAADAAVYKNPTVMYRDGTALWARGFVGQRVQQADGPLLHTFNKFYGGMIGGDWQPRADLRLGAFVGGGQTKSNIDDSNAGYAGNASNTTSDLIFGGAYARYFWGNSFLHGVVQVGHSRTDTTRVINNNLVPGGLEFANASYDGWYVSPELTYGFHYGLPSGDGAIYTLTPSVQVRYLYASFDSYTESGTTAPLTVTRTLGDFEERGQLKLTRTISGRTEMLATSVYGGILGVQRVGNNTIGAVLLGQAIPFATPGDNDVWAGFGGAEVALRTGNIATFLAGEYYAFSDSSKVASARGGVRISF